MFRNSSRKALFLSLVLLGLTALPAAAADSPPVYRQVAGVAGNVNSVGSDTLNNLMALWSEAFREIYPNVAVQVEGKGSSTAPPALTAGAAQIGPMSRLMKTSEIEGFEKSRGFKPTPVAVAVDCLAIYVHRDNPIPSLSLPQADAIFSSTRKLNHAEIARWGEAGLTGDWANRAISVYGRNAASGTYAFFKEIAMGNGDYKNSVKEQPGSAAVVNGVAGDLGGIGYSGIGYRTSEVRVLPVADGKGGNPVEPTFVNALNGKYPLARLLYIYIPKDPKQPLPAATREFLRFALSSQGQELVEREGYGALPLDVLAEQLKLIE
ncbi:MAG: phosphate ABC transporter substrate-binding protein [Planctomycetota bacterium]|jgi:phosphate transport system substrate-binding protein|nr:phosphate ABC transporter substrate-binding protein [Planctomycetota bacterium]